MKILLSIFLCLLITWKASSQIIQQSNTYQQGSTSLVTLNPVSESPKKMADTNSIAITPKAISIPEPKEQLPISIIEKKGNESDIKFETINSNITLLNSAVAEYNAELDKAKKDSTDASSYKAKMEELLKKNELINLEKNSLRFHLRDLGKKNISLKKEADLRIKELERNNTESEKKINILLAENFQLIKNDYSRFIDNANFRTTENNQIIKTLVDTISIREKNINEMQELFNGLSNNKDVLEVSKIIFTFQILVDSLNIDISNTKKFIENNQKNLTEYKSFDFTLNKFADNKNFTSLYNENIIPSQKKINESITTSAKEIVKIQTSLTDLNTKINTWREKINEVAKKYKSEPASDKTEDYTVIGGLNKMLNDKGALIPAVTILGNRFFGDPSKVGNAFGQIKLFMGGTADNVPTNTAYNFFAQTASSYGLMVNIGYGFSPFSDEQKKARKISKDTKAAGLLLSFAYVSKRLKPNDSTTIDPGVIHWKTGGEWIIFPNNVLSLHSNINGMFIGSQYDKIKSHYTLSNDTNWFVDAGLSTLLNLTENQKLYLKLDLDFLIITPKMKSFINTKDSLIPQFKIDIVKNF